MNPRRSTGSNVSTTDLRSMSKQLTGEVLAQPGSTQRFAPSPLQNINPDFIGSSFLPSSVANPFAGALQYQRAPGAQYTNYAMAAPNVGGPLQMPLPPAGFVPPSTQPEVIRQYPDGTPVGDEEEDLDLTDATQDQILENINKARIAQGQEPFESIEEFQADLRQNIGNIIGGEGRFNPFGGMAGMGPMYAAEGGIASLEPQGMFLGGLMGAIGQGAAAAGGALAQGASALGGAAAKGLGSLKDIALKGMQNYNSNTAAGGIGGLSGKRIEDMTREELLEYIKSGGNSKQGLTGNQKVGKAIAGGLGFDTSAYDAMAQGGLISLAEGGDVDFPRMNGPISGPGTETSDDIPAMLSDGEFVVNAKAVRGIGKLEGAGKSKEEQRREGARMMYALQRAGEKAMRKA
jgi:hypothetical protein